MRSSSASASQNAAALTGAGFTQAADLAAMESSFRAHLAFQHTTTQIDVNACPAVQGGDSSRSPQQLMNYAVSIGLVHVQFANASLTSNGNTPLYALMQSYGPKGSNQASITFQTMPTVPSAKQVIARALTYGATSVELPRNPGSASSLKPLELALDAGGLPAGGSTGSQGVNPHPVGVTGASATHSSAAHTAPARAKTRAKIARLASAAAAALLSAATAIAKAKPASASTRAMDTPAVPAAGLTYASTAVGVC